MTNNIPLLTTVRTPKTHPITPIQTALIHDPPGVVRPGVLPRLGSFWLFRPPIQNHVQR